MLQGCLERQNIRGNIFKTDSFSEHLNYFLTKVRDSFLFFSDFIVDLCHIVIMKKYFFFEYRFSRKLFFKHDLC